MHVGLFSLFNNLRTLKDVGAFLRVALAQKLMKSINIQNLYAADTSLYFYIYCLMTIIVHLLSMNRDRSNLRLSVIIVQLLSLTDKILFPSCTFTHQLLPVLFFFLHFWNQGRVF